ncbi:MAG: aminotransferase class V-fold PLP-dependent enzyme [Sediminibacterium sp.]|nr:aminotransferase class V-fold PLP-dependent enzyme [Sediminibacterium sp.]
MNDFKNLFLLDPNIHFLNFGSFGACPKPVMEKYIEWQYLLEREPVQFIAFNAVTYLKDSRQQLANYVGCDLDDIVYVTNPSYAVNIIAKSLKLQKGDEVLTTDLEYGACDRTWQFYCDKNEVIYKKQKISLPILNKEQLIHDFFKGITEKTKVIFISGITSSTALILPFKEICTIAKQKGLITFVDGAHIPGQIFIDLQNTDIDYFTGACHKWMMTPKGSSFLYAKKSMQHLLEPLIVSWGYKAAKPSHSLFLDYHQMQGTRDFSAFLTVPTAIEFMKKYEWEKVAKKCHEIVLKNAPKFCDLLKIKPIAPLTNEFIGQMLSIPIKTNYPEELQKCLFNKYAIEIPIMVHYNQTYLRYSINAFNEQVDLNALFVALEEIMKAGKLLETIIH